MVKRHYVIKDGKILRKNPFCPRCGTGVFMADKGEWWSCGKCGDRYFKKQLLFSTNEASAQAEEKVRKQND